MANIKKTTEHVSRISLIDSKLLDNEILSLVECQFSNIVKYSFENLYVKFKPELLLILNYYIISNTLKSSGKSVGQQFLNIKYTNSQFLKRKLDYYCIFLTVFPWLKTRSFDVLNMFQYKDNIRIHFNNLISFVCILYKFLNFFNLVKFLKDGKYTTLEESILKLLQIVDIKTGKRKIAYTYFTRELMWHGFAELFTFILPLLDILKLHSVIQRVLPHKVTNDRGDDVNLKLQITCSICNCRPILPYCFGCQHMVCYYCIYSSFSSNSSFRCLLCNHVLESYQEIIPVKSIKYIFNKTEIIQSK